MKNLSLVMNAILAVAVIILFYLHFSSHNGNTKASSDGVNPIESDFKFVYIKTDSLMANYELAKEKREELLSESDRLGKSLQERGEGLQKEFQNFQQNSGNLTPNQARSIQENLLQKEENFKRAQANAQQQLLKLENEINQEIGENVKDLLGKISKESQIDYVFGYNSNSSIMYAADTLDITDKVIEALNETYLNKKDSIQ